MKPSHSSRDSGLRFEITAYGPQIPGIVQNQVPNLAHDCGTCSRPGVLVWKGHYECGGSGGVRLDKLPARLVEHWCRRLL